jgi:CRP-like cAMP-binding protein
VLAEAGGPVHYAWFVEEGVISIVSSTEDGDTVELAMFGAPDGVVGGPAITQGGMAIHRIIVQIPGSALRIKTTLLERCVNQASSLQQLLLADSRELVAQLARSIVCHRFHAVSKRLARWLLMIQDRTEAPIIPVTQEAVAATLGVSRTAICRAVATLQDAGCVHQRHGRTVMVNRSVLRQFSCECYGALKR